MPSGRSLLFSIAGWTSALLISGCFADVADANSMDVCESEDCSTGATQDDSTVGSGATTGGAVSSSSSDVTEADPTLPDATGADSTGPNTTGADTTGVDTTGVDTTGVDTTVSSSGPGSSGTDESTSVGTTTSVEPACGNGVLEDGEACDDGDDNSDTEPDACRTNCAVPSCGDAVHDSGEDCDTDAVGCLADCTFDAPDFGEFPEAVAVIGQPDMTSNEANGLGVAFRFPAGVVSHEGRVLIGDGQGVGVFIFDSVPAVGGTMPDAALGLEAVDGASLPFGPSSVGGFSRGFSTDGTRLAIADAGGPRILLFDSVPATSTPADVVVAQPDFETQGSGLSQEQLVGPRDVSIGGGRMAVADFAGNRVVLWNAIPQTNGALPDVVLGQGTFDEGQANRGGAVGPDTLSSPVGVWTDGERLAVSDHLNHRVLLWDSFPTQNGQPADHVVGQVDMDSAERTGGPTGLSNPFGITFVGNRLYVSDQFNHRVLIYEGWPEEDGVAADALVGHSGFDSSTPNDQDEDGSTDATCSSQTLTRPSMIHFANGQLFVADAFNNRVVVFEGS